VVRCGILALVIDKVELRRRMRQVLELVDDRELRSVLLWGQLAALPQYQSARVVMAFASMPTEPDTDGLMLRLARDGKVVVLPRMEDAEIVPCLLGERLVAAQWGIREPTGDPVDPASIDLVVVPGLAFTTAGGRLGHGKGFYDRFLPRAGRALWVGACFSEQLVDVLPVEAHDVRLHRVLSA
jgi:5-formyltetrahydrofolate cyclo-ligase